MKPWNRNGFQPAIGLMIDEHEICMSVTAATSAVAARWPTRPSDADQSAEEVFKDDARPVGRPDRSLAFQGEALGAPRLPEARVFQAAVPITSSQPTA